MSSVYQDIIGSLRLSVIFCLVNYVTYSVNCNIGSLHYNLFEEFLFLYSDPTGP